MRPVNELINGVRKAGLGDEDVQIDTNAKGQKVIRFPFSIPGF